MLARLRALASRIHAVLSPARAEREFREELETHLEMLADDNVRKGMGREEARRAARVRLGGLLQLREANRELRGLPGLSGLGQDVAYAGRVLRRSPAFTAVAILTLGLGIGANTAVFSVVYAVMLKPLPCADSGRLFNVFQVQPQQGIAGTGWSYPNYRELREQTTVFSGMAGAQQHQLTLRIGGEPSVVSTAVVTPELFSVFGVEPLAGRALTPEDGRAGALPVVVLGERLWRRGFGADPRAVGRSVLLDQRPFTVVGVMPASFRFPLLAEKDQVWIPLAQDPLFGSWMEQRGGHWLQVTGRLRKGVSPQRARGELDGLGARLARAFPAENEGWGIRMAPLQSMIVGDAKSPLLVLLGAVGLVLLIACANVAHLLLARASSRAREIAVRTSLGAGRARVVRQLLTESAVLGLLGGAAGIGLAWGGVRGLGSMLETALPLVNAVRVDAAVLLFALALSLAAGCAFGLAPAWFATGASLPTSLREGGPRAGEPRPRRRARTLLAAGEIALAMVLLVAAGLLLRSFANLLAVDPGFDVRKVVKADVSLPRFQYPNPPQWAAFADELLRRLEARPGLADSAVAVPLPIANGRVSLPFDVVGRPPSSTGAARAASYVSVSPGYFRVMGIPLVKGRLFDGRDVASSPEVCLVSQAMARVYFAGRDPIGERLRFGFPPGSVGSERAIVGVVGDVRDAGLGQDPGPMMYVPFAQAPFWGGGVVVKSALDAASVATAIRREVRALDPGLPVTDVATLPDSIDASLAQTRLRTLLLGLFAAIALALAATGIFGVVSYSVACRTNEIGLRVALGATHGAILRMVLGETLLLALAGLAVGVPCALGASRLIAHLLFRVPADDPATLAAVAAALGAVAALAGYVPARRAMGVNPIVALRHE
jgi:predicted permease